MTRFVVEIGAAMEERSARTDERSETQNRSKEKETERFQKHNTDKRR